MSKQPISGTIAAMTTAAMSLIWASSAIAVPSEHLNWGHELSAVETACPAGTPVVNVVHKAINGMDSGVGGNYWAHLDYVRQIDVVEVEPGIFCATVKYKGNFETVAGASPGNTGAVGDGVVGTFQGGYTATVEGTLSPTERTKGSLGRFDYGCDPIAASCATPFNWLEAYFAPGYSFAYVWWGWVYHAGNNGSWIHSSPENSGDITDD